MERELVLSGKANLGEILDLYELKDYEFVIENGNITDFYKRTH